ncbi:MAG: zinc-dependent alcohol dehydrogenase family protein [Pseudomonadota bacterium]
MRAMRLVAPRQPLRSQALSTPPLDEHDLLLEVSACGVCRTDLHLVDFELPGARYPVTPGHEIVGRVIAKGNAVTQFQRGDRLGVPWLGRTCGRCRYCRNGAENLCDRAEFTGCTLDGGFATHAVADARYCLTIPEKFSDAEAAPLLCAGLIGYRAYRACGDAPDIGFYGFGAAAHLLAQVAIAQGRKVYALTRPGDLATQAFARELGATWAGGSDEAPPAFLDAAILFAPEGSLVPRALAAVRKGGRVVCAGIHMSDIPAFSYDLLWGERTITSVANLTRADGREFMALAAELVLRPSVECFPLDEANTALERLRAGQVRGAAVLVPSESMAS